MLALIWQSSSVLTALIGAALAGLEFALVFPSFGVQAAGRVDPADRGRHTAPTRPSSNVALGVYGPLAGGIAGRFVDASVSLFAVLSRNAASSWQHIRVRVSRTRNDVIREAAARRESG